MNKIFVYGTLKSDKIQYELFGKVLNRFPAKLDNYSLFEAEDGWYFIKENKGKSIDGYVIELNDRDLVICDAFEDCPTMYQRRLIKVLVENKLVEAYVYLRVDNVGKYKEVTDFTKYSKLDEDEVIKTEIKNFKEIEHPEFYN